MKFTEEEIKDKKNIINIEEENLNFHIKEINIEEDIYLLKGDGYFKEELYKNFIVEVSLLDKEIKINNAIDVVDNDWEWYEFRFNF